MMVKMVLRFFLCCGLLINTANAQVSYETDQLDEFLDLVNGVDFTPDIVYSLGGAKVADTCQAFMTRDSVLGENGRDIFNKLTKDSEVFKAIFQGGTLIEYCPIYSTLKTEERAKIWVLVLTMMAHFESSCNASAVGKKNPDARGYYQLYLGKEEAHDAKMDYCVENSSLEGKLSNSCAIAMLEMQMRRTGGKLFHNKSYWDVLRPNGEAERKAKAMSNIQRALSRSSICGATAGNTRL